MSTSPVDHFPSNERQRQEHVATTENVSARAAIIFVPRHIPGVDGNPVNIIPRPLPGDCRDEEQAFIQDFEQGVLELVREFRREFPYKQTIRWCMEYGDDKQYTLEILVKPSRRSMDNH